jgi:hypothetical protein
VGKIVTLQLDFRILVGKSQKDRSCTAADIMYAASGLIFQMGGIHQETPGIVFILSDVETDEGIIEMGKEVVVFPSSCS